MIVLGQGAYGTVLTDGKLAYKFLSADSNYYHYTRFFEALCALNGSGIGDDIRPCLKAFNPGYVPIPCICMPIYGPTLFVVPLQDFEHQIFRDFLVSTIHALESRGVCHRDFSLQNVARRINNNQLVLLDMDSAFLVHKAPSLKPEFGLYCPFFSYPGEVLPRSLHTVVYEPAVCNFTMWFSAQALYNIAVNYEDEQNYLPLSKPPRFFGLCDIFTRAAAVANLVLPPHVLSKAQDVMDRCGRFKPATYRPGFNRAKSWIGTPF